MRGSSNAQKAETDLTSVNSAITSLQNNKQNKLTFDTVPVSGSSNPITSGAVYTAIQTLGEGYVSNQIVPLGYFTSTATFSGGKRYNTNYITTSGNFYTPYRITYKSSTTTKNKSNGKIEITSTDDFTKTYETDSISHYYQYALTSSNLPSFSISVDSNIIPDGTYLVEFDYAVTDITNPGGYDTYYYYQPVDADWWNTGDPNNGYNHGILIEKQQTVTVSGGKMNIQVSSLTLFPYLNVRTDASQTQFNITVAFVFTHILQLS